MTPSESKMLVDMHEQLNKLIGGIKGNGIKGLGKQVEENTIAIDIAEKKLEHVQTYEGCSANIDRCAALRKEQMKEAVHEALIEKGRTKIVVIKDIVLGVLGLLGSAGTATVIVYLLTHARPLMEVIK